MPSTRPARPIRSRRTRSSAFACTTRLVMDLLAEARVGLPPADTFVEHYREHVTSNHADIGVGTGYCLDRCGFDSPNPRLALIDLQPNCLEYAARRLARYRPRTYVRDVLQPDARMPVAASIRSLSAASSTASQATCGTRAGSSTRSEPLANSGIEDLRLHAWSATTSRRAPQRAVASARSQLACESSTTRVTELSDLARRTLDPVRRVPASRQVGCMAFFSAVVPDPSRIASQSEVSIHEHQESVVCTSGRLPARRQRAWEKVCFYEHIAKKAFMAAAHRLAGAATNEPAPIETSAMYRAACTATAAISPRRSRTSSPGKRIDFDIIEQTIRYCPRIVLLKGGTILIESHGEGMTSVRMVTRYELRVPKLLVHRFIVNLAVAAMHRVVIRDMRDRLEAPAGAQRRLTNSSHLRTLAMKGIRKTLLCIEVMVCFAPAVLLLTTGVFILPFQLMFWAQEPVLWEGPAMLLAMVGAGFIGLATLAFVLGQLLNSQGSIRTRCSCSRVWLSPWRLSCRMR